jgi:hypothetical protein
MYFKDNLGPDKVSNYEGGKHNFRVFSKNIILMMVFNDHKDLYALTFGFLFKT